MKFESMLIGLGVGVLVSYCVTQLLTFYGIHDDYAPDVLFLCFFVIIYICVTNFLSNFIIKY